MLARDPVLHLGEPDPALAGEHAVAAVDHRLAADAGGGEPREPRLEAGIRRPASTKSCRRQFSSATSCAHRTAARPRRGRLVDRVGSRGRAPSGVGEDVELEVVVGGDQLVEAGERLVERPRAVDRASVNAGTMRRVTA